MEIAGNTAEVTPTLGDKPAFLLPPHTFVWDTIRAVLAVLGTLLKTIVIYSGKIIFYRAG
jgi:hypothetical protein